jgi:hypothetical protein
MKHREHSDAGFTIVELVVVLVIMPMIIGAIAAAIIVSESDSGVTQARLSDSDNAQITSVYFGADVQGAEYVTTTKVPTDLNPQVCFDTTLSAPNLVLGLRRDATASSAPLSVGYWTGHLSPTAPNQVLVRFSCAPGHSTASSEVVMSDDVSPSQITAWQAGTGPGLVTITPPQLATAASNGWILSSPSTALQTVTIDPLNLSLYNLAVASTAGFQPDGPLSVNTPLGDQTVTCTGITPTPPTFTGCASSLAAFSAETIGSVSQSISINLSVTESGRAYTYSLSGSPRATASPPTTIP